jgi:hypothetical protein
MLASANGKKMKMCSRQPCCDLDGFLVRLRTVAGAIGQQIG